MRNLEEYNNAFRNKIAFVIGSGPSLAFTDLNPISQHLTIAVNSGYLAFPESNFFLSDDHSVARWSYFQKDLKYAKTIVLLYERMLKDQAAFFGDRSVLFKHRRGYHVTDKYSHTDKENYILEARTSVGSAIHVAHIMGCSKIVLLGIDCRRIDNKRYFWEFDRKKYKVSRSDGVPTVRFRGIRKKGVQTDSDLMQIQDYWTKFGNELNKKCKIYNVSKFSSLEIFPKIEMKDILNQLELGEERIPPLP